MDIDTTGEMTQAEFWEDYHKKLLSLPVSNVIVPTIVSYPRCKPMIRNNH